MTYTPTVRTGLIKLRSVCLLTVFLSAGILTPGLASAPSGPQAKETAVDDGAGERPVILLTGFEPFGARRPPNPSWEGIAPLNDTQWKEYRLVCKQMPVVWGAPLEHLQGYISKYQPVAIFSLGQGLPGAFAFESRASVRRGGHRDNNNSPPPKPTIVEDGPEQFRATIDCQRLSKALAEKGYPTRVSTNAGRYLCEENLYALEYLKANKRVEKTVMFCHVPPLGSQIKGKRVDSAYVQQFVEDLLSAWHTMYHEDAATPAAPQATPTPAEDPKRAEVEEMIRRYFQTWSNQDMVGYGACFLTEAVVQFIDSQDRLSSTALGAFLVSQREAHRRARDRQTEVPESIDIRFEQKLARVVVYWKLTTGPKTEYGYDHFTLMKVRGQWRIVNLVFYATKPGE
jgi:pyroglutamyl-peptidase